MKTIFISVYDGDTEKVILRSGVLKMISDAGHRVVLLIRGADRVEYYRKEFGNEGVIIEGLPSASSVMEQLWYFIGWNTIPTHASFLRRRIGLARGGSIIRYGAGSLFWILGHARAWREFLRFLYRNIPDKYATELFDKYKPDLVFAPNMFSAEDCRLLRAAQHRKTKSITTAKSWDVLTTKAFTRVKADRITVFNEYNKEEAVLIGDYNSNSIVVTGFPQFDIYSRAETFLSRDEYCKSVGANPNKEIILFAVPGDWKTPYTKDIFAELDRWIEDGGPVRPIQILARLHPKYADSSEGVQYKNIIFDRPGTHLSVDREFSIDMGIPGTYAWTFSSADLIHLANSIFHCAMVINIESTLTLDATAVGRPSVLVDYDGNANPGYWESVARVYEREHYRHVTDTHAAPLVKSHTELEETINNFLSNPNYLKSERSVLEHTLLYKNDGLSGQRVANEVLSMLN